MLNFRSAEFIKSAATAEGLIESPLPIIAVCGKSNVGKSSVINCLTRIKGLAKVGAKPGKTIHINYFKIDGKIMLADLPGYGYAAVAKSERDRWAKLCEHFFANVELSLGILIVDMRHKPTADDMVMANWYNETGSPVIVIANKQDKVKKSEQESNLKLIEQTLNIPGAEIIPFSAETGYNRDLVITKISSKLTERN